MGRGRDVGKSYQNEETERSDLGDDSIQIENGTDGQEEEDCRRSNVGNPDHKYTKWRGGSTGCNCQCKRKDNNKDQRPRNPITKPCQVRSGPVNLPAGTAPRTELEAIAQTSENGIRLLVMYTDHRNHAMVGEKGRGYCTRPRGQHVVTWKRIWTRSSEIRRQGNTIEIKWIRAYQQWRHGETFEERKTEKATTRLMFSLRKGAKSTCLQKVMLWKLRCRGHTCTTFS